jgi:hypothetical protein
MHVHCTRFIFILTVISKGLRALLYKLGIKKIRKVKVGLISYDRRHEKVTLVSGSAKEASPMKSAQAEGWGSWAAHHQVRLASN